MSFSFTSNVIKCHQFDDEFQRKRKRINDDQRIIKNVDKRTREDDEKVLKLEMEITKLMRLEPIPHEVHNFSQRIKEEITRYLSILIGPNYNDYTYYYNLERLKKYLLLQKFK